MKKIQLKIVFVITINVLTSFLQSVYCQNTLSDSSIAERIKFIQNSLQSDESKTKYWWNGWLYGYSVATIGQGAVCLINDNKSTRQDMALGAITTLLGAANQFITPLKPYSFSDSLSLFPERNRTESISKLVFAEKLLKEKSLQEEKARNWQTHAICGAVNLGSGLITWLGFKRTFRDGLSNFALNTAISEAQIWSQPIRAKKDYEKYVTGSYQEDKISKLTMYVSVFPGGAGIHIIF
jgi:hypothetical protein